MTGKKYTRQTVGPYPDPEGTNGQGIEVTAWTDDAWLRNLEAQERRLWRQNHPILYSMGLGLNRGLNALMLNDNNIRVRNAQAHPEAMDAIQEGGNIAGATVAAPFLTYMGLTAAPELLTYGSRLLPEISFGGGSAASGAAGGAMGGSSSMALMMTPSGATIAVPAASTASFSIPSWVTPTALTALSGYMAYDQSKNLWPAFMADAAAGSGAAGSGAAAPQGGNTSAGSGSAGSGAAGSGAAAPQGGGEEPEDKKKKYFWQKGYTPSRWVWNTKANSPNLNWVGRHGLNAVRLLGLDQVYSFLANSAALSVTPDSVPYQYRNLGPITDGIGAGWRLFGNLYKQDAPVPPAQPAVLQSAASDTLVVQPGQVVAPVDDAASAYWAELAKNFNWDEE